MSSWKAVNYTEGVHFIAMNKRQSVDKEIRLKHIQMIQYFRSDLFLH